MADVLLNYRYSIEYLGTEDILVQEFTPPTLENREGQYGNPGNSPNRKVPTGLVVSDATLKGVMPAVPGAGSVLYARFEAARVGLYDTIIDNAFVIYKNAQMIEVQRWLMTNAWVKKITPATLNSNIESSEILQFEYTLSVENFVRIL